MDRARTTTARTRGRPRLPASAVAPASLPRAGLHEQVADRLKAMIVRGEIGAGSPLGEAELSAALGVSRTPLREALKLLAAEGLVELRPNRTARVPDWDADAIRELFETLAWIERLGAELAATRVTDEIIGRLRNMQADLESRYREGHLQDYFAVNQDIHRLIMESSGNRTLIEVHRSLGPRAQWARLRALSSHDRWKESADEHWAMLAALEARDPDRAARVAHDHVLRTGEVIAEMLGAEKARAEP